MASSRRVICSSNLNLLDDVAGVALKAGDVGAQVVGDVVGVAEELLEVELRGVVELGSRRRRASRSGSTFSMPFACSFGVLCEHRVLRRLEHAVEAPEDDERQDDLARTRTACSRRGGGRRRSRGSRSSRGSCSSRGRPLEAGRDDRGGSCAHSYSSYVPLRRPGGAFFVSPRRPEDGC